MSQVTLNGIRKVFRPDVVAVDGVDLQVADGEFLAVLGPSGSGKSTLLRLIAGLDQPTSGTVEINGSDVTHVRAGKRDVAMVFQSATTLPHMSVADNLGLGLRIRRRPRREIQARVAEVAELLGIARLLERKPHQLSGGERQRVAIGRALLRDPHVFLMDEPLASLDAPIRHQLRLELSRLHRELGATVVYVTHDQSEALTLGSRIAVMCEGKIEQIGSARDIYHRPASRFVGEFVGSPPMNFLPAKVGAGIFGLADQLVEHPGDARLRDGTDLALGVRPNDVTIGGSTRGPALAARVLAVEDHGSHVDVHVALGGATAATWVARVGGHFRHQPGDEVSVLFDPARLYVFDAVSGAAVRAPDPLD